MVLLSPRTVEELLDAAVRKRNGDDIEMTLSTSFAEDLCARLLLLEQTVAKLAELATPPSR